ncbi:MAG TPA: hypothetical protein VGT03_14130 [Candidatus Acidoferrales bacterium]|nr:hypothetical protein [Candidatus Acidoferrales bacterium]
MLQTLEAYLAHLQALLHNSIAYVEQNQVVVALVASAIVLVIFASWLNGLWKRLQARRELRNNELVAYHLDRIASSLERLSRSPRSEMEFSSVVSSRTEAAEREVERQPGVGSMFGFGRAANLVNPLYRPK